MFEREGVCVCELVCVCVSMCVCVRSGRFQNLAVSVLVLAPKLPLSIDCNSHSTQNNCIQPWYFGMLFTQQSRGKLKRQPQEYVAERRCGHIFRPDPQHSKTTSLPSENPLIIA